MKSCTLCGQEIIEGNEYQQSYGLENFHQECAFDYFKGQQGSGNCFCGGCITEEGYCDTCGTIADDVSLEFVFN